MQNVCFEDFDVLGPQRTLRLVAYCQFTWWIHKQLGCSVRRVIPACAASQIGHEYPEESAEYTGFQEAQENWLKLWLYIYLLLCSVVWCEMCLHEPMNKFSIRCKGMHAHVRFCALAWFEESIHSSNPVQNNPLRNAMSIHGYFLWLEGLWAVARLEDERVFSAVAWRNGCCTCSPSQVCYGRIEAKRGRFVVWQGMRLDYCASDSLSRFGHVTTA